MVNCPSRASGFGWAAKCCTSWSSPTPTPWTAGQNMVVGTGTCALVRPAVGLGLLLVSRPLFVAHHVSCTPVARAQLCSGCKRHPAPSRLSVGTLHMVAHFRRDTLSNQTEGSKAVLPSTPGTTVQKCLLFCAFQPKSSDGVRCKYICTDVYMLRYV